MTESVEYNGASPIKTLMEPQVLMAAGGIYLLFYSC
jgi:hypothetical protein